jgi:hypothetical protein
MDRDTCRKQQQQVAIRHGRVANEVIHFAEHELGRNGFFLADVHAAAATDRECR